MALAAVTKLPQISEDRILGVAKHLSEGIGYRTVGTYEHALADNWMVEAATQVKHNCERIVERTGRKLECEVWRQEGSGNHRFDMMGKRLYKTYVNLSNIIVRISDGTPEGKEHAVLVNSHLDSTLPSPGAADDALSVGVMLDCMRVLIETPEWSPKHAIIFLFNHAEESLQDGSHLFSTQHPIASTVRAVVNLEAAGTTGREILFQATSEQMIEAYSHVPRPHGTVFANDIFSSGIILSDTDFRQFEYYLNVTGLDMAVVGNSYLYHMRKDLVENIEPGVAQHMGENTLALLKHLSSSESRISSLTEGYSRPTTVYFSHLGQTFFIYSFQTAKVLYSALLIASFALGNDGFWKEQAKGAAAVVSGTVGTLLVPNVVAIIMRSALNKGMSWFKSPMLPLGLYAPAALLGRYSYLCYCFASSNQATLALGVQMANVGSAAIFFLNALPIFIALVVNTILIGSTKRISLWTYGLGQTLPSATGLLMLYGVLDVFVPLTGRIGADAPADNIVATIIASLGAMTLPLALPFAHRFGRRALLRGIIYTSMATALSMAFFATLDPFDSMHQKRLFILHTENVTSSEHHLHLATADGAPGFHRLVEEIAEEFSATGMTPVPIVMNDDNSDWDNLYPFSAFLTPYKIPLAIDPSYVSPWASSQQFVVMAVEHNEHFLPGTRNLTVHVLHPGLIWTVVAFDAHVLQWSIDDNPPNEYARHHIKEGSFYGTDTYSFDMVVKVPSDKPEDTRILINFIGLEEKGMWPAKKAVKAQGGASMLFFEELDQWLDEKTGGEVDALLMGSVAGIAHI
ncbi:hypothetical protein CPB84DRAFT_1816896 [Gymnopilus junonius]|uniref:Peptide hydrolase n=1 Tax=Gymnopilus junonius TaxID=109634 RepID=A0A9P5NFE7_GYMJU|nr:hypothetical protein CPB84DRAFT_1816896 [Gymnopilus junonius]